MHTTLITGINGFAGQHLARAMKEADCRILGVGQQPEAAPGIAELASSYFCCDLTKPDEVARLPLEEVDSIINLAGLANVGASFDNPELYTAVNVGTLQHFGERLLEIKHLGVRIIAVSTGAVYDSSQTPPFNEEALLVSKGTSPYVASKLLMEEAAQAFREWGLDCVVARPFNHIGPGQGLGFLLPDLAEQIKKAQQDGSPGIAVGNLANQRDFTDVRDVVAGYRELVFTPELTQVTYNICSGRALAGQTILNLLLAALEVQNLEVTTDDAPTRPNDPPLIVGDHSALTRDTGWQPTIPVEQTVADFVSWQKSARTRG